jgi:hypothetical protein
VNTAAADELRLLEKFVTGMPTTMDTYIEELDGAAPPR